MSQANGDFYVLSKAKRNQRILTILERLILENQKKKKMVTTLSVAKRLTIRFQDKDLSNPSKSPSISERNALAKTCLKTKNDIESYLIKRLKGIEYKDLSNEEFKALIGSDLSNYFCVVLYLSEFRAKLLEYLLH